MTENHATLPPSLRKHSGLASLALALTLAGCGMSDSGAPQPGADQAAKSTHTAPATASAEGDAQDSAAQQGSQGIARQTKASTRMIAAGGHHSLLSGASQRLYGPGVFNQNALANTIIGTVGGTDRVVSNRFRATVSGHLTSVRLYWQPGRGYSSGSGGQIRIRLMPDDGSGNHRPNMNSAPLASGYYVPGWSKTSAGRPIFDEIRIVSHQAIQAGRIYHLVMDNVDRAPGSNYISSNNAITVAGNGRPSRWHSASDWGTLLGHRRPGSGYVHEWQDLTRDGSRGNHYIPILQMRLSNGQSQGVSNMEGGAVDPKLVFTATANTPVRERFTPRSDKHVAALSFATAASVAGSLRWRILENGQTLATGWVTASRPNYKVHYTRNGTPLAGQIWYDVDMPQGRTLHLRAGRTYDVELHPEGRSQWKFADRRNGSHHGFSWPAAFTESRAQHRRHGNWIDAYHWNYAHSRGDANWPVVLHLAR